MGTSIGPTEFVGAEGAVEEETGVVDGKQVTARSPLQLFWRRLRRDKVAMLALGIVVIAILVVIFAPLIVKVLGALDRLRRPPAQRQRWCDQPGRPQYPGRAQEHPERQR